MRRHGLSRAEAREVADSECHGVLYPEVELDFVDRDLAGSTVKDVLENPQRFKNQDLADPIEGRSYGRTTAMVLLNRNGEPFINSFAHGGCKYDLKWRDAGVNLEDFRAFMTMHSYIYMPTREMWPGSSVNARIQPVALTNFDGTPKKDKKGQPETIPATLWLDQNKPVEQMTWAPGLPMLIPDRIIAESGWIERRGVTVFNLYRPPNIEHGDPEKAKPWLDLVHYLFNKDDCEHMISCFASRVQHPEVKINHGLVIGSEEQGIGKDTILEPVIRAVGSWNCQEVSPKDVTEPFKGFLKSVILRISEVRDLGDLSRYDFYEAMKPYSAAPPETLRVNEKYTKEYHIFNCTWPVYTTNNLQGGMYLPATDRRHYVAWSDRVKSDFDNISWNGKQYTSRNDFWNDVWKWINDGGDRHVAAHLATRDITGFNPKAPPLQTAAFWAIVDANRAPEESELADVIDRMGKPQQGNPEVIDLPPAITLSDLFDAAGDVHPLDDDGLLEWLKDRKNRRVLPMRLKKCGYVQVRNDDDQRDGQWKIGGKRQTVYALATLSIAKRHEAVKALVKERQRRL